MGLFDPETDGATAAVLVLDACTLTDGAIEGDVVLLRLGGPDTDDVNDRDGVFDGDALASRRGCRAAPPTEATKIRAEALIAGLTASVDDVSMMETLILLL